MPKYTLDDATPDQIFRAQLQLLAQSLGSQEALAFLIGATPRTITRWMTGQSQPQQHYRTRVSLAYWRPTDEMRLFAFNLSTSLDPIDGSWLFASEAEYFAA